ncbi:siderophore ferric iron reductase [Vibrio diazotrophicus]|uniref:siderophore ferric iron reductase n=1 Tax=Vibrio diazotrophicus TaxID=685 RepID=UPI00142D5674|nr:siderophore ferric iron reductase [Vibrio diazotrophicus]NIY93169.1 siderophore ferric iron reductase [Vibrio diazotrophicus]
MGLSTLHFEKLFLHARQITPYLDGYLEDTTTFNEPTHSLSPESIELLYTEIAKSNPEAGQAYWLTRTWDLLCWQPIFVSFVAIYTQRALPDVSTISQHKQNCFIAGFSFRDHEWTHSCRTTLINKAGQQLSHLFQTYSDAINQWGRIRPGFTHHLFADQLLNCLVRLQEIRPSYSNNTIRRQAELWLDACNLPNKHINSLKVDETSNKLKLVRTSCCLVYKCKGRSLCANCPRLEENKSAKQIAAKQAYV